VIVDSLEVNRSVLEAKGEGGGTERRAAGQGRVIAQYVHGAVSKNATGIRLAMAAVW
jgi:hypothetical protein